MMVRIALRSDSPPGPLGRLGATAGALLATGVVTLLGALLFLAPTMAEIVLLFGINAILVIGFQVFVGNTGIVSFGHVAFMAVGAYAGGIAAMPVIDKEVVLPDLPGALAGFEVGFLPALLVGGAAAALLALLTGPALMRLSGAAASIATLGLLIIVSNVLAQATPLTRGPQSLFGVPENTTFIGVYASLAVMVVLSAWFKWSAAGLRARAVRDQPAAAEAAGVSVLRSRLWAFVLSAFITGVAGALYAQLLTAFSPGSFYIPQLVLVIAMAIVGGVGGISGALLGTAVITVINEVLRKVESGVSVAGAEIHAPSGISFAALGVALILMLRWRPSGLLGASEVQFEPRAPATEQGAARAAGEEAPAVTTDRPTAEATAEE
ncbi:branched-chain amino acid ABC transporter permease [Actinomadura mexicana]|uniref:Amino acid/amide ABC transporter membrane protein 2, HAAT family n=1 Tax=Actinomadura mexicana TaxID=134959 RepID=A0A238XDX5_9ACTN|nr:branched-chain amino acid ABC transporter permease [Actinomadura mexicana]SNR56771.1 amino acid/amide ABC transporter membrane protein 2, HAAT family [Actinomadura mexicana]